MTNYSQNCASEGLSCTIVIPCYNEEENVLRLLDEIELAINETGFHFLVVDNGSTDFTPNLLASKQLVGLSVIRLETNAGYGGGILAGVRATRTALVGWMHADLQTSPRELVAFESKLVDHPFAKGLRQERQFSDRVLTLAMSFVQLVLWKKWLPDINGQPTIVDSRWMASFDYLPNDFSLDLCVVLKAAHEKINFARIPVPFRERHAGQSKWNFGWKSKLKFSRRVLIYSIKYRFHSLAR